MDVKKERELRGLSQQELSAKTGIPKDRIAKWEQRKGTPKTEDFLTLKKFFEDNVPRIPQTSYVQQRNHKKNTSERKIPLFDAPAAAGLTESEMTPVSAPAGTIDVGDLLHDSQAAIRIYGNSMIPNYPAGTPGGSLGQHLGELARVFAS